MEQQVWKKAEDWIWAKQGPLGQTVKERQRKGSGEREREREMMMRGTKRSQ